MVMPVSVSALLLAGGASAAAHALAEPACSSRPVAVSERGTADHLLLQRRAGTSLAERRALAGPVAVSTFFWNVHWECSMAANGASKDCKAKIGQRFVELAQQAEAEIVASIELSDTASKPASLSGFGLSGWSQVDGPCAAGSNGDTAALAFAPGWKVEQSDGGCLRHDGDTRAFAVARVVPPSAVQGCPSLCVVALHAPHTEITEGKALVQEVCGAAAEHCAIAMGDWNAPASGVPGLWAALIGGDVPSGAQPDERTCCFPESEHSGVFDHLASNIAGAEHGEQTVHPYQLEELNPVKQHKAVAARIMLPAAGASMIVKQ